MATAMLSFKIGPVQPFIEAARTLRDLWSGSYLLSWLTAHAMKPIVENYGYDSFVTPHVTAENPLLRAVMSKTPTKDEAATLACLPHTFAAVIPNGVDAGELRAKCVAECRAEWARIADAVREVLRQQADGRMRPFLESPTWHTQIESYFELTCIVRENQGTASEDAAWAEKEWDKLAELLEMTRSVRHVPAYSPAEKGRFPVKCSQLGSYEQIGPADFDKAKAYWAGLTRKGNDAGQNWEGLHGTGLQSSDKLCAVALVKRFVWPAYLAKSAKRPQLDVDVRELRLTDTATMAARRWLSDGEVKIDPKVEWTESKQKYWSGQWLHWTMPEQDDDAICPHVGENNLWDRIQAKKHAQGKPPTYFALMHLDGDNMGGLFQGSRQNILDTTEKLTKFAAKVKDIVRSHSGELIYAGGDDVLAFLPTETAIECARELREEFGKALPGATLSGGVAVVHYKEDLRFALGQVRAAEKKAKQIGKAHGDKETKDALALTVCKRSGEHSTVVIGWDAAKLLKDHIVEGGKLVPTGLIQAFVDKAPDRWTYKLRDEVDRLTQPAESAKTAWPVPGPLLALSKAEMLRLVGRGEFGSGEKKKAFLSVIESLFDAYQKEMQVRKNDNGEIARNWPDAEVLTGFVTLCQSASFLARGRE